MLANSLRHDVSEQYNPLLPTKSGRMGQVASTSQHRGGFPCLRGLARTHPTTFSPPPQLPTTDYGGTDNFAIMKNAPHADAAYAWLNYLNQADAFWIVMRDHSGSNPNAAAVEYAKANQPDVYATYMKSNISNVPSEAVKNGHWLKALTPKTPPPSIRCGRK